MPAKWWLAMLAAALLEGEQVTERDIAPGQIHDLTVQAQAGQFLHAALEQKGADVILTWIDPAGKALLSMDTTPALGFEYASTIAAQSGAYVVRVQAKTAGRYRAVIDDPRAARSDDLSRIQIGRASC